MTAKDLVKAQIEQSRLWLMSLLQEATDILTTPPTPNGGNHPHWVAGHVIYSEASLVSGYIEGKSGHALSKWDHLFGKGTAPDPEAKDYPSLEEMLTAFEEVRAHTLAVLDSMSDDDLESKSHAPEDRAMIFGTVGQCFNMVGLHPAFHAGQVADSRRAAGKAPVFG